MKKDSILDTRKIMTKEINNPRRNEDNIKINWFKKQDIEEIKCDTRKIVVIGKGSNNIIYLHGGAYVSEASILHVRIIRYFLKHGFKVSFLDYPVAPESYYKETNAFVMKAYDELCQKYPEDKFYLFGDSAGGGLALSFLKQVRDKNKKSITKAVLFSPWVDLTMSNKLISEYVSKDNVLPLGEVKQAGLLYARGEKLSNELISPIYGNVEGLCPLLIFGGTNEILYPDIELLYKKIGSGAKLVIGENMQHDWILFPIKESKKAMNSIIAFFKKDS